MAHKVYMIENYVLRYDKKNERPWIIFHYKLDGRWRNVNISVTTDYRYAVGEDLFNILPF